jgi:hypothetical protein
MPKPKKGALSLPDDDPRRLAAEAASLKVLLSP